MRRQGGIINGLAIGLVGSWILAAQGAKAVADVIVLRGGGEIQGKIMTDPKNAAKVQVLLMNGKTPLVFQKTQILEVIIRPGPLDEYLARKQKLQPTAQSEYDLGAWCQEHRLKDLAQLHFEAAVGFDRGFEPAHQKLGHVQHGGQWLSPDELRQARGLVKYRGKWISEEERSRLDESAQLVATQSAWLHRIKLLRQAILVGAPNRRREAETEVMQIREPAAVPALLKVLGKDDVPFRLLLAHALGRIEGKEATRALVSQILAEPEDEVRSAILEELRPRDQTSVVPPLVRGLKASDFKVVNRAAWTLGNLDALSSVPDLPAALVSTEERMVMASPDAEAQGGLLGGNPGPMIMGMNQSSIAYLTPPAMAPGAIAYGAVSVPFYNPLQQPSGGVLGVGGGPNRGPVPRVITYTYQNTEVLAALARLTGENFGYDANAWRRWIKTSFNPHPRAVRQVEQP